MRSLKIFGLVSAIASIFLGAVAQAQLTFRGNELFKSGNEVLIYTGSRKVAFTVVEGRLLTRNLVADACGRVSFHYNDSSNRRLIIGNQTIEVASLPMQISPNCVNGQLSEPRPNNYKDSAKFFLVGFSPNQPVSVSFRGNYRVTRSPNSCGIVRWKIPSTGIEWPDSDKTFSITYLDNREEGDTTFSSLSDAPASPRCFTVDAVPRLFVPVDWQF